MAKGWMDPSDPAGPVAVIVSPTLRSVIAPCDDLITGVSAAAFIVTVEPSLFVMTIVVPEILVIVPEVPRPNPPPKPEPVPPAVAPVPAEALDPEPRAAPEFAPPKPPNAERRLAKLPTVDEDALLWPYQAPAESDATTTRRPPRIAVALFVHL